jgi:hypothetical protein
MYKMMLRPDADGYSSTDGTEWIQSKLDGGRSRFRRDKIGAAKAVSVSWTLNRERYQYWRAFYATVGSNTFICELVSEDGSGPKDHECNFIPGSVVLPSQFGLTYVQQAQLEVKPLPRDAQADLDVILLFEATEGNSEQIANMFERLATVTIPNAEAFDA